MPLKHEIASVLYGPTPKGHCVKCKEKFSNSNTFSPNGWRETELSGFCEICWDETFPEDEED